MGRAGWTGEVAVRHATDGYNRNPPTEKNAILFRAIPRTTSRGFLSLRQSWDDRLGVIVNGLGFTYAFPGQGR